MADGVHAPQSVRQLLRQAQSLPRTRYGGERIGARLRDLFRASLGAEERPDGVRAQLAPCCRKGVAGACPPLLAAGKATRTGALAFPMRHAGGGDPRRGVRCSRAVPTRGPRPARPALPGRATRGMDDPTNDGWSKPQLSPQNGSPSSAKSLSNASRNPSGMQPVSWLLPPRKSSARFPRLPSSLGISPLS